MKSLLCGLVLSSVTAWGVSDQQLADNWNSNADTSPQSEDRWPKWLSDILHKADKETPPHQKSSGHSDSFEQEPTAPTEKPHNPDYSQWMDKYSGGGQGNKGGGFDYSQYMGGAGGGAGGFDYSQYMSGSKGADSDKSATPGGFDYSQYMGGQGKNGAPGGFDYSQYMGGQGGKNGAGGFDYSQYMGGQGGKTGGFDYSQYMKGGGGFDYSQYLNGGAGGSKVDKSDDKSSKADGADSDYSKWAKQYSSGNKDDTGSFDYSQWLKQYSGTPTNAVSPVESPAGGEDYTKYLPPSESDKLGDAWKSKYEKEYAKYQTPEYWKEKYAKPSVSDQQAAEFGSWNDFMTQSHLEAPAANSLEHFADWKQTEQGAEYSKAGPSLEGAKAYVDWLAQQETSAAALPPTSVGPSVAWQFFSVVGYVMGALTLAVGGWVGITACKMFRKRRHYEELDQLLMV